MIRSMWKVCAGPGAVPDEVSWQLPQNSFFFWAKTRYFLVRILTNAVVTLRVTTEQVKLQQEASRLLVRIDVQYLKHR